MKNHSNLNIQDKFDIFNKVDELNKTFIPIIVNTLCNRIMIDILTKIVQCDYSSIKYIDSFKDNLYDLMFIIDRDKNIMYSVFLRINDTNIGKILETSEVHVLNSSPGVINELKFVMDDIGDIDIRSSKITIVYKSLFNEDTLDKNINDYSIKYRLLRIGDDSSSITGDDIIFSILHLMITSRNLIEMIGSGKDVNILDMVLSDSALDEAYDIENGFMDKRTVTLSQYDNYGEKNKMDKILFRYPTQLLVISIVDRIINDNGIKVIDDPGVFDDVASIINNKDIVCMVVNIKDKLVWMGYKYNTEVRVVKCSHKYIIDSISTFLDNEKNESSRDTNNYYMVGALITNPYDDDKTSIGISGILSKKDYIGDSFMDALKELNSKLRRIYVREGE